MGFVDRLIPIPSSDYLLTKSILRNSSSVFYNNAAELKKAIKVCDFCHPRQAPDFCAR